MDYSEVTACRICGSTNLLPVLSMGSQSLTGHFPRSASNPVIAGPMDLVLCHGDSSCGLVQLKQSYKKEDLYHAGYGYHSSLNASMVRHLTQKVRAIERLVSLQQGDLVIDIGANDSTLLSAYRPGPRLLGVDPLGEKLRSFYPPHIELLADFFSAEAVRERVGDKKARVITSVAMFYDLPQPLRIVEGIASLLADDGIWISEQSYLPAMIEANAYDTICHEHVEYYGLRQFQWMAERCGLKIVDVELNDINGGSFSVTLAKSGSTLLGSPEKVQRVLASEDKYAQTAVYAEFEHAVQAHRDVVRRFFADAKAKGQTVLGLGASTKGNVLLQYCGLTAEDLPMIGEVNPEKFGCVTPGSHIPIVAEEEMRAAKPDVLFVLPWHFKPFFIEKERSFLEVGGKLCFPLPNLHVVDAGD